VDDASNGYEAEADHYIGYRAQHSLVGVTVVRNWARSLPYRASVLDLGCGPGAPLSQTLIAEGCRVYGVDASPKMIAAFRTRFPDAPSECGSVLTSRFFDRTFDGVLAWGLMFLLTPDEQQALIQKVAAALAPAGQFVFTAPWQVHEWDDALTRRRSFSLGAAEYRRLLENAGLELTRDDIDEGDNYYYFAQRPEPSTLDPATRA
jgi:SAM-dependent methyltransferase